MDHDPKKGTKRKGAAQAEQLLRASELSYRRLFEAAQDGILILDPDTGRITDVNPFLCDLLGFAHTEMIGKTVGELSPFKDFVSNQIMLERLQKDGYVRYEDLPLEARDGRKIAVEFVCNVYPAGEMEVIQCNIRDIRERKREMRLEKQSHQRQKMESIGQLAGGLAHDFNDIFGATLMHLGILLQTSALTMGMRESLREIERETLRAANLTRQLLLSSQRQLVKVRKLNLNELLNKQLKTLRKLLSENIEFSFSSSAENAWVSANVGMLEQVVVNLCINARDAMPNGGSLTLGLTLVELDHESAGQHSDARPGSFVVLSVTDTGCGMDKHILERLFEPFFTTKAVGGGAGLGLATVYGIVEQHQGWIQVASEVGRGSSFSVYLPAETAPMALPDSHREPRPDGALETGLEEDLSIHQAADLVENYQKSQLGKVTPVKPVLSEREKQFLRLIAEGQRNKEIATNLELSPNSIETYRARLMKKIHCRGTAELVRYAIREGIATL